MPVPVTELEKQSPLYKYFEMDMGEIAPSIYQMIENNPLNAQSALRAADMNLLFDEGYLPGEFGYCLFEDGTATMANLTYMPNVTVEMFDWWFAWHGLEPIRYKIWDKDNHLHCLTRNRAQALNRSLSMKERYWNTVHDVCETHIPGGEVGKVAINFRNPADIGFSPEKLRTFNGTIVCAGNESNPVIMCHFVRPVEEGIEVRTRFWMGYSVIEGKPARVMPEGKIFPVDRLQNMLLHNVKEFTNLASLLPKIYPEYNDKF